MASKGGREKIKLESTAGTGHFYTTTKNKKETRHEILHQSFKEAVSALQEQLGSQANWQWSKVHTVKNMESPNSKSIVS